MSRPVQQQQLVGGQRQILCPKRPNGDYNNAVSCDGPIECARLTERDPNASLLSAYETRDEIDKKRLER